MPTEDGNLQNQFTVEIEDDNEPVEMVNGNEPTNDKPNAEPDVITIPKAEWDRTQKRVADNQRALHEALGELKAVKEMTKPQPKPDQPRESDKLLQEFVKTGNAAELPKIIEAVRSEVREEILHRPEDPQVSLQRKIERESMSYAQLHPKENHATYYETGAKAEIGYEDIVMIGKARAAGGWDKLSTPPETMQIPGKPRSAANGSPDSTQTRRVVDPGSLFDSLKKGYDR